jgi:AraC family transcriptional regulator
MADGSTSDPHMSTNIHNKTLGRRVRAAEFRDIGITETCYAPRTSLGSHEHDFTYLSLVLHGGFEESVGRNTEVAQSASVVVMPRGVAHCEHIGPLGARSITVTLKSPISNWAEDGTRPLEKWRWFHGGAVARLMLQACHEWLLADDLTELALHELLLQLPEAISGEPNERIGSMRRYVARALEVLHSEHSSSLRLANVAASLGTDPAYLARAFRQRMGCTMSQYRRRLWVREAAHLLASAKISLCEVAMSAGFTDQSHLCRVFKAELGVTPQTYRTLAGSQ